MGDYIVLDRDGVINVDLMTYVTIESLSQSWKLRCYESQ